MKHLMKALYGPLGYTEEYYLGVGLETWNGKKEEHLIAYS